MDKKEQILHYHRIDGLSLREIARRTGLNRKTVTRYIREYESQLQADPKEGVDMCLASRPKYPQRNVERTKLTEAVCAEIEYWLMENAKRRQTGMRKQCLKRQDIHRALLEKGFNISYSSVCKYIQRRKMEKARKPKDGAIEQSIKWCSSTKRIHPKVLHKPSIIMACKTISSEPSASNCRQLIIQLCQSKWHKLTLMKLCHSKWHKYPMCCSLQVGQITKSL